MQTIHYPLHRLVSFLNKWSKQEITWKIFRILHYGLKLRGLIVMSDNYLKTNKNLHKPRHLLQTQFREEDWSRWLAWESPAGKAHSSKNKFERRTENNTQRPPVKPTRETEPSYSLTTPSLLLSSPVPNKQSLSTCYKGWEESSSYNVPKRVSMSNLSLPHQTCERVDRI